MSQWKAGVAKVDITPDWPVYMAGYGNRTTKHDDVQAPIFARALALEAADGTRAVLLSLELLGTSNEMTAAVQVALKPHGVAPEAVRLSSTHTHSAPSLSNVYCGCCHTGWITLHPTPEDTTRAQGIVDIAVYTGWVTEKIIEAATEALAALEPAVLTPIKTSLRLSCHPTAKICKETHSWVCESLCLATRLPIII